MRFNGNDLVGSLIPSYHLRIKLTSGTWVSGVHEMLRLLFPEGSVNDVMARMAITISNLLSMINAISN